ncbi:MAG: hypothetical protein J5953_04810 [Prevotella sp.]|nr:hypothetical protein [Prevotella sp.]MBO5625097.1 hypothetical protein [Prevotella sp.]
MKTNNKTIQIHFRTDEDTFAVLKKASGDIGLTMSEFLRYVIHKANEGVERDATAVTDGTKYADDSKLEERDRDYRALINLLTDVAKRFHELHAELGKIGGNLNQAVRNMNSSLKSGAKGVDPQDERMVRSCSEQVSVCIRGIGLGISSLKQIVKKL